MGIFEELVLDDTSEELTLVDLKTLRAGQGNQGRRRAGRNQRG